jgi:excisionase family DNA binding protein
MEKEYLKINELSEYLGIKQSTLYFHVENCNIPFYKVGKLIRFKKQDIDQWMAGNKKEAFNLQKESLKKPGKPNNPKLDIRSLVKKTIDEVKGNRYTPHHGRPDRIKGLRKEVENGAF